MRHLAPTEAHGQLNLVAVRQKADRRAHLHVEVVVVDIGAELQLLYLDDPPLLARLVRLPLLLEAELPVVEYLAHRLPARGATSTRSGSASAAVSNACRSGTMPAEAPGTPLDARMLVIGIAATRPPGLAPRPVIHRPRFTPPVQRASASRGPRNGGQGEVGQSRAAMERQPRRGRRERIRARA